MVPFLNKAIFQRQDQALKNRAVACEKTDSVCAGICRVPGRKPALVGFFFYGRDLWLVFCSKAIHNKRHIQKKKKKNPHDFSLMGRNLVIKILALLKPL